LLKKKIQRGLNCHWDQNQCGRNWGPRGEVTTDGGSCNPVVGLLHAENTCCAWAEGTYMNYPDFCENHDQFHVIYCVTLAYVLYFEEFLIHDSGRFMICKKWLTESVGPVPFSAEYLICRCVTDELIRVGLGNLLWLFQVYCRSLL
jgi:hypothetical protein